MSEQVDGVLKSEILNFNPDNRKVKSDWNNRDNANDNNGVRPSGSGMAFQNSPMGCSVFTCSSFYTSHQSFAQCHAD